MQYLSCLWNQFLIKWTRISCTFCKKLTFVKEKGAFSYGFVKHKSCMTYKKRQKKLYIKLFTTLQFVSVCGANVNITLKYLFALSNFLINCWRSPFHKLQAFFFLYWKFTLTWHKSGAINWFHELWCQLTCHKHFSYGFIIKTIKKIKKKYKREQNKWNWNCIEFLHTNCK